MAGTTPIFGFPYPESSDLVADYPALGQDLAEDIESVLSAGFGKVLQVVRATDTTNRSTTSTSFVDVTGMSVTITPQKSTSAIMIVVDFAGKASRSGSGAYFAGQITDASNNVLSGGQNIVGGFDGALWETNYVVIGYATPATTSPVTYKLRFRAVFSGGTTEVLNATKTGQMYAIEVSA